jgi:nucleoside-diphosphate-sugar epimerase
LAKVLVTGAQGCIGSWVVKQLLERGDHVVVYDLDPKPVRIAKIAAPELVEKLHIVPGQIEDTAAIKDLVRGREITHICHLAAVLMPFCQAQPVQGGLINVIGTLNVFEAARDAGWPVRVVYASSSAVWGPEHSYEHKKLSEEEPLKPATHYGIFKQANEGNARVFHAVSGITSVGLRPWAVYGFGRDLGLTADPTLAMRAVVHNQPFQIRLSGFMDMQYVEDVAATFVGSLFAKLDGAYVFNLAGQVISMEDLIGLIDEVRPGAAELLTNHGPQVPVAYQMDDSQLLAHVPGLTKTALKDGVRKTLEMFEREKALQAAVG